MKNTVILTLILVSLKGSFLFSQVNIVGSAQSLGDGCYQLTQAINTQNGAVWFEDQIDLNEDFDINLVMNFGNNDGGADGMCFVLQNNSLTQQGTGGGGVGYLDIPNSVGIEFDTWQNAEVGDPVADHIGISSNGTNTHNLGGPIQADLNSTNIEDGDDHDVRIKWTSDSNLLEVYFDCEFRLSATQDIINTSFGGNGLVYWGFVASTGGASNNQTVCMNSGSGAPATFTTCTGAPVELNIGDIDTTQPVTWSPADFLSSTSVATPTSSTTENITYSVDYTHVCGYEATSEVAVLIQELEVTPANNPTLSCDEELVLIQAESNYTDINIDWSTEDGNITVLNGLNIVADVIGQYTVEVNYQELCFASYTFDVGIDPFGIDVELSQQSNLSCINNQVVLGATVSSVGVTFDWSSADGTFESGTETYNPVISSPGTYVLSVELDENCMGEGEIVVTAADPLELVNLDEYLISCIETNLALNVSTNYPDMEFSWDDSDGNIFQNEETLTPQVSEGGDYIISATYGNCEDELIVTVEEDMFVYQPILSSVNSPDCINDGSVVITFDEALATVEANSTFSWSTSNGELISSNDISMAQVGSSGTYTLEVENTANGCVGEIEIPVDEVSTFSLNVPSVVLLTCENPVVFIEASVPGDVNDYNFQWVGNDFFIQGQGENSVSADEPIVLELTTTYGDCSRTDNINVELSPNYSIDLSSLDAPNVFSPNSDEFNILFRPILKDDVTFDVVPFLEDYKMTIYSRWGNEIYSTTNSGWDGKINGDLVDTGVYFYTITFNSICGDSASGELTGTVTLLK